MRPTPRQEGTFAATLALLVASWCGGCGKSGQANPDGGDGSLTLDAPTVDAPLSGRRSFDVIASLRADGATNLPPTSTFTFVLDAAAGLAIVGGNGLGGIVGVTSSDGRTFKSAGIFEVGAPAGDACGVGERVSYENFEVTIAGNSLTGTANGAATISCGDCAFRVNFSATLSGTVDTTLPTLRAAGSVPANPFDSLGLNASEPMPVGVTAKLVADDGATIDLVPAIVDGAEPLVMGFFKPDVVLRAGQGYVVTLDGLVDFAGLADRGGPPLRITSFVAAASIAEDGFESAPAGTLGGAMVMTAAGPLPPIAGNTSLYIGAIGAPGLDAANGRSLTVRLARQAGDTKLRFSYRMVGAQMQPFFVGFLRVGSEGAPPGSPTFAFNSTMPVVETLTVGGTTAYATAVVVAEEALPTDATDQVLVVIAPLNSVCLPFGGGNAGLLIDDMRLE